MKKLLQWLNRENIRIVQLILCIIVPALPLTYHSPCTPSHVSQSLHSLSTHCTYCREGTISAILFIIKPNFRHEYLFNRNIKQLVIWCRRANYSIFLYRVHKTLRGIKIARCRCYLRASVNIVCAPRLQYLSSDS